MVDIVQQDNVSMAFCNHCNKGAELSEYKQMVELWSAQAQDFGTHTKGVEEITRLETDPEVLRLVRILRDSGSWEERSDAWLQIRKLGPGVKGWLDALKELIYAQDGWSRIFAAEALAINECCPEHAVPVLVALLECSLEDGRNDWARVACGAIGKYKSLSSLLAEQATPALLSALDSKDSNVAGYAEQTLSGFDS